MWPVQIKADAEQYFPLVLFFTLYKVVLTFESADEILAKVSDLSNESYCGVALSRTSSRIPSTTVSYHLSSYLKVSNKASISFYKLLY